MPVEVHVPLRLRVTPEALSDHGARIDSGLERTLARALRRSRAAVHGDIGEYLEPVFPAPDIRWSGPRLPAVSPAVRRDTERRIAAAIRRAARQAARIPDPAARAPLDGPAAEPFDASRALAFGRYRIDSYRDGDQQGVAIDRIGGANQTPFVRDWDRVDVGADYDHAFIRTVVQGEALAQGTTLSAVYGLIVRGTGSKGWTLILSADNFAGARTVAVSFGPQMRRRPSGIANGQVEYEEFELVPPLTSASVTEVALPEGSDELVEQLAALLGPAIGTELRDRFDPSQMMDQLLLSPDELDTLITQETENEIRRTARALSGRRYLLRIDWGDQRFNVAFDQSIAARIGWDGTTPAVILPAVREEQRAGVMPIGTGNSGESGTDSRAHGGGGHPRQAPGGGSRFGTEGDGTGTGGGGIFPGLGGGSTLCCEPFLEVEPALDALGSEAAGLRRLVDEIAERLSMQSCGYAATFCIGAAETLAGHAAAIGATSGDSYGGQMTMPRASRFGAGADANMGHAEFRPAASRGIQLLRRLSQVAGKIAELRSTIRTFYMDGPGRTRLGGRYAREPVGWVRRFEEAVSPNMKEGVGEIFAQTCQLVMLQLLDTSAQQIAARQRNLQAYAPLFRDILIRRLSDIGTLTTLRDRLRAHELAQQIETFSATPGGAAVAVALPQWSLAANALASACTASEGFSHLPGAAQEIVSEGGVSKIRDAHGFLWTRAALEQAIAEQRGAAESMDPLIQQLSDIPETVEQFRRDPDSAETLLSGLLARMEQLNLEKRIEAASDLRFGLRVGRISESARASLVPGLAYDLAGVHLIAHEQIYPFFGGESGAYAEGVDHIFSVELGIAGITHFFTFTGLVLLAVVCAPAAFAAGVGLAAVEVEHAEERRDLYRALINPELVLNRTEVELECYIAYAGLALALLPEAGTAIRAVSVGVRGAARRGAMVGLRLAARSVVRHVTRQVTEQLAQEMLPALIREVTVNLLMEQVVVPQVVGPIIASVERELRVRMSVGGIAGAEQLIAQIEAEANRRAAAPLAAGLSGAGGR